MTAKRFGGIALVAAGLLFACERWEFSGVVVEKAVAPATETPIAKAEVSVDCPNADGGAIHVWAKALTDADGGFLFSKDDGSLGPALDCKVTVTAQGFEPGHYAISTACKKAKDAPPALPSEEEDAGPPPPAGQVCLSAHLKAELLPVDAGEPDGGGPDAGEPDAG